MTTASSARPKDKFYRRYAAAYVLGIPADEVKGHTWRDLFPKIYAAEGEEQDEKLLARFRETKAMMVGLPGKSVIEMVKDAEGADDIPATELKAPEAPKKAPAKTSARKSTPKADQISDADAIQNALGG